MLDLGAPLPAGERIHIYELPLQTSELNRGYCFAGAVPVPFLNVDWFDLPDGVIIRPLTLGELIQALFTKPYAKRGYSYLVLGETFAHRIVL